MRSAIELFLRAMIGDLQISNSDDWDLDWDLDIFETMIEGVILISFFSGVPNSSFRNTASFTSVLHLRVLG